MFIYDENIKVHFDQTSLLVKVFGYIRVYKKKTLIYIIMLRNYHKT